MKPNVDLTLSRDFEDRSDNRTNSSIFVSSKTLSDIDIMAYDKDKRIPWSKPKHEEMLQDDAFLMYESSNLLFVGNKKERAEKLFFNSEYDETICYCCGKKIKMPWQNKARLCHKCNEYIEQKNKIPLDS